MFEKEAEEAIMKKYPSSVQGYKSLIKNWKDGAEFGFNKAKDDADKMKSRFLELCNLKDMRIKELEKANEWNYVKDGVCPTHSNRVLVFTDEGVGFGIYGLDDKKWHTYDTGFDVIAWKEIVIPELKEGEQK